MTGSDGYLTIDTPENVSFNYEIAGLGSRFGPALIDTAILAVALLVINGTAGIVSRADGTADQLGPWLYALLGIISFAVIWFYYIFFEIRWNGRSPGKRMMGYRVISRDGTPLDPTQAVIRNLVRVIDFLPIGYGVGIVAMFIHPQSLRLGDMAANTLVVRDSLDEPQDVQTEASGYTWAPSSFPVQRIRREWPIERLSAADLDLIREYLQRRHTLTDPHSVAQQLLDALFLKMGVTGVEYQPQDAPHLLAGMVQARDLPAEDANID